LGKSSTRIRRFRTLLATLLIVAGCSPSPVGPPVEAGLEGTDVDSAALIGDLVAEAAENPRDASRRAALGMAYEVSGLIRSALACYEQAVALAPDEPRFRYHQAHARARLGDVPGAVDDLQALLELSQTYAPALVQQGQWLLELGRIDEASGAFERALQLEPNHPGGWLGRARVHLKLGEAALAVEILERLLDGREHPYLYQLLGLAHREAGELDRARAALARARPGAPTPSWPDPWLAEKDRYRRGLAAAVRRAESLLVEGRYDEAIKLLEQPLRADPTNEALRRGLSLAYHGIARNLRQARRFDDALAAVDRAVEVGVARPELFLDAGALEAKLGNWDAAVKRFEQALQLDPSFAPAYVGLGGSKAELGDFTAAGQALDRAAEIAPGSPAVQAARRRLAELRASDP